MVIAARQPNGGIPATGSYLLLVIKTHHSHQQLGWQKPDYWAPMFAALRSGRDSQPHVPQLGLASGMFALPRANHPS